MKKKDVSYHQFADDIFKVHGTLLQVKESFNRAVDALKEMQTMNTYVQEACSFKVLPFDTGDEDGRIASINLSDEGFLLNLSRIIHGKSGLERCAEMQKVIIRLVDEIKSFNNKWGKLNETIKLLPQKTDEDRVAYNTQIAARQRVVKAVENRKAKLNTIIKRYMKQRRANIMRQLGIDELMYGVVGRINERVNEDVFRKNDIYKLFESFKVNDTKAMKGITDV